MSSLTSKSRMGRVRTLPDGVECFAGDLSEQEKKVVWATHFGPAADLLTQTVVPFIGHGIRTAVRGATMLAVFMLVVSAFASDHYLDWWYPRNFYRSKRSSDTRS